MADGDSHDDDVACQECGNDLGPYEYRGRRLCLDCLELLHNDPTTDVLVGGGEL